MEFNIRIANVSELTGRSYISRWEMMRGGHDMSVTLFSHFTLEPDEKRIMLDIGAKYMHVRNMMQHVLADYHTGITFDVNPFPVENNSLERSIRINPRLLTMMYSAGIGALRGMLAIRLANTPLKDYPLPLINISSLVSEHLYGSSPAEDILPFTDLVYN